MSKKLAALSVLIASVFVPVACSHDAAPVTAGPPMQTGQSIRSMRGASISAHASVNGSWQGVIIDSAKGMGAMAIGITQTGSKVQTFIAAKWKVGLYQAHINGTVATSGGVTKMTLTGKGCDGKWTATYYNTSPEPTLAGHYALGSSCAAHKGSFRVQRVK
jgi:hypothetical protein